MKVSIMKKIAILLVAAFALLGVNTANAQSRTSYFMEGSYFRSEFNPALVPTRGYFMIPGASGLNLNIGTNFLSFDNLIYKRGDQYVTALHKSVTADDLMKQLPKTLKVNANVNVNLFGLGFYTKKIFWSVGANLRTDNNLSLSPDIFRAIKTLGNGTFNLGSTAFSSNEYVEAYVGTAFPLLDWLTIGVKGKFLFGLANAQAEFDKLYIDINENAVTAQLMGTWKANSPVFDNRPLVAGAKEVGFNDLLCINDMAYMQQNLNNFGAAVDFGVEMRFFNNHLKVSAAVADLGIIKWAATSHIGGEVTGGFQYTGVEIGADGMTEEIVRPLDGSDTFINTDNLIKSGKYEGYPTRLSYSINVGAEYNILKNKIAFGVFSQTKMLNTSPYQEVTASVNLRPTNWLSATVSQTLHKGSAPSVFGAAINFHPAMINFYLGVDFIDSNYVSAGKVSGLDILIPRNANSLCLYTGMAFNFGRPKHLKPQKKAAEGGEPRWE